MQVVLIQEKMIWETGNGKRDAAQRAGLKRGSVIFISVTGP
jgi:hypothetical protein